MANRLAYFLRRAPVHEVYVKFEQVVELIGFDKADELAEFVIKKSEVRKGRQSKKSAIPANKRVSNQGIAGFKRLELLAAIEEAQGANFQIEGTALEERIKGSPNPDLVPDKLFNDLKARGIPEYQDGYLES